MIHFQYKIAITKEKKISLWGSTLTLTQREQPIIVNYDRLFEAWPSLVNIDGLKIRCINVKTLSSFFYPEIVQMKY